mmetsp:Transcript_12522/g.24411  ORF Transcript_12522/g.24411 Transcript_12522/m.24411 type:complete len:166 (-) Transcript_12522:51-548(-)
MGNCPRCSRGVPRSNDGRQLLSPSSEKLTTLQRPHRDADSSIPATVATAGTAMTVPVPTWQQIGHFCVTYVSQVVGVMSLILFLAIICFVLMPAKHAITNTSTTSTSSSTTTTLASTLATTKKRLSKNEVWIFLQAFAAAWCCCVLLLPVAAAAVLRADPIDQAE